MSAFDPLQTLTASTNLLPESGGRTVEFWASSESDATSYPALERSRRAVEQILSDLLRASQLSETKLLLRYVPIVMPAELLDRYPARSEAKLCEQILDCAPQLDHSTFVDGSPDEQMWAYVEGIRTSLALLPMFGLSPAAVQEFDALLAAVVSRATG